MRIISIYDSTTGAIQAGLAVTSRSGFSATEAWLAAFPQTKALALIAELGQNMNRNDNDSHYGESDKMRCPPTFLPKVHR